MTLALLHFDEDVYTVMNGDFVWWSIHEAGHGLLSDIIPEFARRDPDYINYYLFVTVTKQDTYFYQHSG